MHGSLNLVIAHLSHAVLSLHVFHHCAILTHIPPESPPQELMWSNCLLKGPWMKRANYILTAFLKRESTVRLSEQMVIIPLLVSEGVVASTCGMYT